MEEIYTPCNIANLREALNDMVEAKSVLQNNNNARQEHLEASAYDLALKQLESRSKAFTSGAPRDPDLQFWIWTWHTQLEKHLKELIKSAQLVDYNKQRLRRKHSAEELLARRSWNLLHEILPCVSTVPAEKLSLMTILELVRMQAMGSIQNGMKATATLITLGRTVEQEFKAEICRQSNIPVVDYEITRGNYFSDMGYKFLHERRLAAARSQELDEQWQGEWSQALRSKVGAFLVNALESVATVTRQMIDPNTKELM